MLDGLPLDHKLRVAVEWFRRAQTGEFDLGGTQARRFADLLDDCQDTARMMAVQAHIDAAHILVLHERLKRFGAVLSIRDWLVPANDCGLSPASRGRS